MTIELGQLLNPDTDSFTVVGSAGPDTEYTLPNGVGAFWIQSRTGTDIRMAFKSGRIASGDYVTIAGSILQSFQPIRVASGAVLYLRSSAGGTDVLEIVTWQR